MLRVDVFSDQTTLFEMAEELYQLFSDQNMWQ